MHLVSMFDSSFIRPSFDGPSPRSSPSAVVLLQICTLFHGEESGSYWHALVGAQLLSNYNELGDDFPFSITPRSSMTEKSPNRIHLIPSSPVLGNRSASPSSILGEYPSRILPNLPCTTAQVHIYPHQDDVAQRVVPQSITTTDPSPSGHMLPHQHLIASLPAHPIDQSESSSQRTFSYYPAACVPADLNMVSCRDSVDLYHTPALESASSMPEGNWVSIQLPHYSKWI